MRTAHPCTDRSRSASPLRVARRRRACVRGRDRAEPKLRRRGRRSSASRSSQGRRVRRRLPEGAVAVAARRRTRSSGARSRSSCCSSRMWKFGVPAVKNMEKAREDRIRNDLEGAEKAKTEAEAEKAQYHAQLADAENEAGRIIEEARQAAEQVRARPHRAGRGRGGRDPGAGRRPTSRNAARPGDGRAAHRRRDAVDRPRRAHRRAQPRPRHADRQLVDSFIDQVGSN